MNLYLDDDMAKGSLVARLRRFGHLVILPNDAGLSGAWDPLHLLHAVQQGLVLALGTPKLFVAAVAISRGLLFAQAELGDHQLAHLELLQLAGDRLRKLADKAKVSRHLVVCQLRAAELP